MFGKRKHLPKKRVVDRTKNSKSFVDMLTARNKQKNWFGVTKTKLKKL